jgi:hypothetical protein
VEKEKQTARHDAWSAAVKGGNQQLLHPFLGLIFFKNQLVRLNL